MNSKSINFKKNQLNHNKNRNNYNIELMNLEENFKRKNIITNYYTKKQKKIKTICNFQKAKTMN